MTESKEQFTIGALGWAALITIALLLAGCASSSSPPAPIPAPTTLRDDLKYGYYGDIPKETLPHTNLTFISTWDAPSVQIQSMMEAQAVGNCIMLDLAAQLGPLPFNAVTARPQVINYFQALKEVDVLKSVCALYGIDEPRLHGMDAAATASMNAVLRSAANEFQMQVKIVNVHDAGFTAGDVASADVVGFDNYGKDIFTNGDYQRLKSYLSPSQLIALVPGEMDDITRFFNVAETDKQVWAILSFAWRDWEGIRGIRNSPALPAFRQAGTKIKTP